MLGYGNSYFLGSEGGAGGGLFISALFMLGINTGKFMCAGRIASSFQRKNELELTVDGKAHLSR